MTSLITNLNVPVLAVDEAKFMRCDQAAFCRRYEKFVQHQKLAASKDAWIFEVIPETIGFPSTDNNNTVSLEIRNTNDQSTLFMTIQSTNVGVFRVIIDEHIPIPLYSRYKPLYNDILYESQIDSLASDSFSQTKVNKDSNQLKITTSLILPKLSSNTEMLPPSNVDFIVNFKPFRIDLKVNGEILQSVNHNNLMNFEKYRLKPKPPLEAQHEKGIEEEPKKDDAYEPVEKKQKVVQTDEVNQEGKMSVELPSSVIDAVALDSDNIWSNYFGGDTDQIRLGPSAVGLDIELFGAQQIFGLPEHATSLNLPSYEAPYRSWNLDVFEYTKDSPMALYGTVPFLLSLHHQGSKPIFTGFLWVNPSDTWIRLTRGSPEQGKQQIDTVNSNATFISETGIIDFLMFAGPTDISVLFQYHLASGFPAPSPMFAMAKHQCRWNYNDEDDVESVQQGFDKYEIPVDVLWLDIEHTDAKKYFTWHPQNFPTPEKMIEKLAKNGRKLVAIVDPHIKKEPGYKIYDKLLLENTLIRNQQNGDDINSRATPGDPFEGWCWPGTSVYPDFLDARVREIFGMFYLPNTWQGSSDNLMVWNDMNEPSVFNKPEITCPRNVLHLDGREHREVHNMYGLSFHRTTYEALIKRNPNQRPFVLTRSFYIGSHRYGAVWTGDNAAQWDHLKVAFPMMLSHALSGISFIGADVGGFFGNPDEELYVRWSQQGVWYPFYRDHAHIDSKRREPWMFGETAMKRVRSAVVSRYRLLPEWYTRFMEYTILGLPIIRPLWWNEKQSISDELLKYQNDQFWVGDSILVRGISNPTLNTIKSPSESVSSEPVSSDSLNTDSFEPQTKSATESSTIDVYLSTKYYQWFDFHTGCTITTNQSSNIVSVALSPDSIPVFVKSGSILVTKDRIRRSSKLQLSDPYTISIYPHVDNKGFMSAQGRVFIDDANSFDYRLNNNFIYDSLTLLTKSNILSFSLAPINVALSLNSVLVQGNGSHVSLPNINLDIEKIILFGFSSSPKSVTLNDHPLSFYIDQLQPSLASPSYKITIKLPSNRPRFGNYNWSIKIQK